MNYDYSKRGYLLPKGCKDLIDVRKLKDEHTAAPQKQFIPKPLPPVIGELVIPGNLSVADLAALLKQKPFHVIADLMAIGVFANLNQKVEFDAMSKVARKYGYIARRAN